MLEVMTRRRVLALPAWMLRTRAYDRYGGVRALAGRRTGWFHVERIGGRWFFVTPDGGAFFSLGVTHAGECVRRDERNLFETRYGGNEKRLAEYFLEKFRQWGYNSAGYGALAAMEAKMPYVAELWTEGPRSFAARANAPNSDIFDPAVAERLRRKIREVAAVHRRNRMCLGYVLIDLPIWDPSFRDAAGNGSYLDFLRGLPDGAAGKRAVLGFPPGSEEELINRVANAYYKLVTGELRKSDPNHLVLGDRLMALPERTPDSIVVTAGRYVDVIAFQPMGTRTPLREYIDRVHGLTGKPVLLADVNTMTSRPAKDQADTTEYERSAGEHTLAYYLDAAASKACVGLHRCTVRDYLPWNPRYFRRGLLRADDSPYPILAEYTARTNREVYELVYGTAESGHLEPHVR
ncbi:MAG: hypothetical protein R2729_04875 [Bryobacteraceae bacterium]